MSDLDAISSLQEPLMTETQIASQQIIEEVASWPGVEAGPGDRKGGPNR